MMHSKSLLYDQRSNCVVQLVALWSLDGKMGNEHVQLLTQ